MKKLVKVKKIKEIATELRHTPTFAPSLSCEEERQRNQFGSKYFFPKSLVPKTCGGCYVRVRSVSMFFRDQGQFPREFHECRIGERRMARASLNR